MEVVIAIGKNVNRFRLAKHYSIRMLADLSGISKNQILKIEHGDADPRISTPDRLAETLQVDIIDLLDRKGDIIG